MSQDRPQADDLIRTVREYIERLAPDLPQAQRFNARVAVHLLGIVEREGNEAADYDAAETDRLRRLLGGDGDLADLNTELCHRIRAGDFDDDWDAMLAHVAETVTNKVRIVDPRRLADK
jgi:hypothetical protein